MKSKTNKIYNNKMIANLKINQILILQVKSLRSNQSNSIMTGSNKIKNAS